MKIEIATKQIIMLVMMGLLTPVMNVRAMNGGYESAAGAAACDEDMKEDFFEAQDDPFDTDDDPFDVLIAANKKLCGVIDALSNRLLDQEGISKLLIAAHRAIAQGADVNSRDDNGYMPLKGAIEYNSVEMVKLLLDNGANVHVVDAYRETSFRYAIKLDRVDIIQVFLDRDIYVHEKDCFERTPFEYATANGRAHILRLFSACGADKVRKTKAQIEMEAWEQERRAQEEAKERARAEKREAKARAEREAQARVYAAFLAVERRKWEHLDPESREFEEGLYAMRNAQGSAVCTKLYRKMALRWHPDKVQERGGDVAAVENATKRFKQIQAVYELTGAGSKKSIR